MDFDNLIETFRKDHPECDADVFREFAHHVQRYVADEIRSEMRDGNAQVSMSLNIKGQSFSAKGPRYYVEDLLAQWQGIVENPSIPASRRQIVPGFNRPRLISGR